MKEAKISPFINNWNNIHDFTPVPGSSNHSFLSKVFQNYLFLLTIKKEII